ncbi:MAG: hypothetical protein H6624_09750 [Bdellovibrionaceae bacterium]|nr:hypothetical protein [Bdellovibrionales bacterium]MCB9084620.1 hypothetical protein [Pseudobdellovibrionaceae bacterium]
MINEKLNWLSPSPHTDLDTVVWCGPIRFYLGRIQFNFHYSSALSYESVRFLERYYSRFSKPGFPVGSKVNIYYNLAPDSFSHPDHPVWRSHLPYRDFGQNSHGWQQIVERDFVAWYNEKSLDAYVMGPELDPRSTDSLDNLLGMILPRLLLQDHTLIVHTNAIVRDNRAWLFYGPSGVGKSTLADWCRRQKGYKVIASDQVLLNIDQEGLYAQALPYTIPEIPRDEESWETRPVKVAGLIHLYRDARHYGVTRITPTEALGPLASETISLDNSPLQAQPAFLLLTRALSRSGIILGKMSYPLGFDFWTWLDKIENADEEN